jgi:hypothetical protein
MKYNPEIDDEAREWIHHIALLQCAYLLGLPDDSEPFEKAFIFKMADDFIKRVGPDVTYEMGGITWEEDGVRIYAEELIRHEKAEWNEFVANWNARRQRPATINDEDFWHKKFPKPSTEHRESVV